MESSCLFTISFKKLFGRLKSLDRWNYETTDIVLTNQQEIYVSWKTRRKNKNNKNSGKCCVHVYCKKERLALRKNWNEIRIRMKSRSVCDANVGLMLLHSHRLSATFQRCFSKSFFTSESHSFTNLSQRKEKEKTKSRDV